MKLVNPETKDVIEVPDKHGEMLLSLGFYRLYVAPKRKAKTTEDKPKED